jgi:hypothetical protein
LAGGKPASGERHHDVMRVDPDGNPILVDQHVPRRR